MVLVGELSVKNQRIFALSEHTKMHQFWRAILIKFRVSFKGFSSVMCVPYSYNSRNEWSGFYGKVKYKSTLNNK